MYNMEFFMEEMLPYFMEKEEEGNDKDSPKDTQQKAILDHKRISKIKNKGATDAVAIVVGVFLVACVGGLAAYQSYRSNVTTQDASYKFHVKFNQLSDLTKDVPQSSNSFGRAHLPDHVEPLRYILYLQPNLTTMNYTGLVKIRIQCKQTTKKIYIHSILHKIHKIAVKSVNVTDIDDILVTEHFYHENTEMLILTLNQILIQKYEYDLYLGFQGNISEHKSNGMYLSSFKDSDGLTQPMLMADFKENFSRKIFPCFDEPRFKAHFQLILSHHKNLQAYSNAPIRLKVGLKDSDTVETHFNTTNLLSTYHVTFLLSKYNKENNGKIGLLSALGRGDELKYASSIAPTILQYFQNLFQSNYAFQKLDLSPASRITTDISETVGLVHMYEPRLMFKNNTSSLQDKENVLLSVSGGIVEQVVLMIRRKKGMFQDVDVKVQWISGLVTTKSWNDEWLTTSLITLLKYTTVDVLTDWDETAMFYHDVIDKALMEQSNSYAMPITGIKTNSSHFDVNLQGASILKMFEKWMGKENFNKVLQDYIKKYELSNARVIDFLDIFKNNSPLKDSIDYLSGWINRPGFPLITIQPYEQDEKYLVVKQSGYTYNNISDTTTDTNGNSKTWWFPLNFKFSCSNQNVSEYLIKTSLELVPNPCFNTTSSNWFKVNWGASGFYRVNYDGDNWKALAKQLRDDHKEKGASQDVDVKNQVFPVADRANLISDVFALASTNQVTISTALDMIIYLNNEDHFIPYSIAMKHINKLMNTFKDTKAKNCMKKYFLQKSSAALENMRALKTPSHEQMKLIVLLTEVTADKMLTLAYDNEFLKWLISSERDNINGTWREMVLKIGIQQGGVYEFNALMRYYKEIIAVGERALVIKTLTLTKNEVLLRRLLDSIDGKIIYADDRLKTLIFMCDNPIGQPLAWTYLKTNWKTIFDDEMQDNFSGMDTVIRSCLVNINTKQGLNEVEDFMKHNELGIFYNLFQQMNEEIRLNILYKTRVNEVIDWFQIVDPQCLS